MKNTLTIGVLLLNAGLATTALGQNALGDGRALERNFQRTGVESSPRLDLATEVRMRNAAVTGNATGGRSLQIRRPYADSDEFRASLGSDSLFRFRRDSYSAGQGVGFRGTDALQYQYSFSTGNTRRGDFITRLGGVGTPQVSVASNTAPARSQYATSIFDRNAPVDDSSSPQSGTLRSTSSFISTRALSPGVVGFTQSREGAVERVTASSLLGVRSEPLTLDLATGRYVDRAAAPREETTRVEGATSASAASRAPGATRADLSQNLGAPVRTAYDDLLQRMRERPEPADGVKPEGLGTITPTKPPSDPLTPDPKPDPNDPRTPDPTKVPGSTDPNAPVKEGDATAPAGNGLSSGLPAWEGRLQTLRQRLSSDPQQNDSAKRAVDLDPDSQQTKARRALAGVDDEMLRAIREAGGKIENYLTGKPAPGDLYAEHIRIGQQHIGAGMYFDAEERFATALAMRPGDVTAMVGRLHAELGAGLYMSAALNMRQLYELHPEVIGVQFIGPTMPNPARLAALKEDLRTILEKSAAKQGLASPEAALLLAYVGFQTNDEKAMKEGLAQVDPEGARQAQAQSKDAPPADALVPVLRGVWLGEKLPVAPVAPATPDPKGAGG